MSHPRCQKYGQGKSVKKSVLEQTALPINWFCIGISLPSRATAFECRADEGANFFRVLMYRHNQESGGISKYNQKYTLKIEIGQKAEQ